MRFDGASIVLGSNGLRVNADNESIIIGTDGIQSRGLIIKSKDPDTQQYVEIGNTNTYGGQLFLGSGVTAYIDDNELHVEADLGFLD